MDKKLFSAVVLCYRHFEHVKDAIMSVLQQDYEQIELIVSDDGSANFPAEELTAFIEKNKTPHICAVTVRQEAQNVGTVKHLNHVRRCCHGEYIVFLAGDDVLYNDRVLSSYVRGLEKAPENCYIEMAQTAMYDEKMENLTEYYLKKPVQDALEKTTESSEDLLKMLVHYGVCLPSTSTCFTAAFFERFGDFDESYLLVEDVPMHFRLAKEGWVIHYENFVAIKHRHGGISHGQNGALSATVIKYYTDLHRTMTELILPLVDILPDDERKLVRRYWKKQELWIEANILGGRHGAMKILVDVARKIKHGNLMIPIKKWDWFIKAYLITLVAKPWVSAMIETEFGIRVLPWINALAWVLLGCGIFVTAGHFLLKWYRNVSEFQKIWIVL